MKKLSNFIVEKRYLILVLILVLSIISVFTSSRVIINYDISAYLPKTSETRQGMDIMDKYFEKQKSSSLNIMFKGLDNNEKQKIKEKLERINNVSSVDYNETEDYNNKEYTLYVVNTDEYDDSSEAKNLFNKIKEDFKDYNVFYSGSINKANGDVLKLWIVVFAVFCAFIILELMSESYVEPVLILITVLIAVLLNKGTNIVFPNVSHITNSICAILQMALSMDYSIMLINRYRQERVKNKNKKSAMKNALVYSFQAISSSSVTTIVGLLALVFMSFTIGKDLGFVLAKGVLLSLICIFLCLPGLLLIFDSWILKTSKKSLVVKLGFLGKYENKFKYLFTGLFALLFIGAFFLKGSLGINYTGSENDEVNKYFKENNQIAIIYNNDYQKEITEYCKNIGHDKIDDVLCYGNTINEPLTYKDLKQRLSDLGSDVSIDDYLLKIVYFNYFNKSENVKATYNDYLNFIEGEIYSNKDLSKDIDSNMKKNINKLKNFTDKDLINKKRSKKEISDLFDMDESTTEKIFILYNSENINTKISIYDFITFVNKNVITDKEYSKSFTNDQKSLLKQLNNFINKNTINKELDTKELAKMFNMSEDSIKSLLLLKNLNNNSNLKISISEFIINIDKINNNTSLLNGVDVSKLVSIAPIANNKNNMNALKMNKAYLSQYFGETLVNTVYSGANLPDQYLFTPNEFITFTLNNFGPYLDNDSKNSLGLLKLVIDDTLSNDKTLYDVNSLSQILGTNKNKINQLFNVIEFANGKEYTITPYNLVNFIIKNKNNSKISNNLSKDKLNTLSMLKNIMDGVNSNKKYSTKDMSKLLNVDESKIKLLYSLFEVNKNRKVVTINNKDFVDFMINKVTKNNDYKNNITNDKLVKLNTIYDVINSSLNKEKINYKEMYNRLSKLSNNLDKDLLELVSIYYGSINNYKEDYKLTIEEFVSYLNENILNDKLFDKHINEEKRKDIVDSKDTIKDAKKLLVGEKYSRIVLNTKFNYEDKESFDFIKNIRKDLNKIGKDIYVIGDTPMAYDMSNSFDSELNLITILTMIFIFVVVAITFKSFIIPAILVLVIQCAVFLTMGILSISGENVYFIALLIVQSILMGATIDYAIVYTSYYIELRNKKNVIDSLKDAYDKSIHTILTSSSILIIVTLIVGNFASNIASKICITLSKGTLCSVILILFILPALLATFDKLIIKTKKKN